MTTADTLAKIKEGEILSGSQTTAISKPAMLLPRLAGQAGLEPGKFYAAVKTTCGCEGATDEHFAVLLMTADKYLLNPLLKQLYLMKTQKGVQVIIPVDGWVPLLVNHPDYFAHDVQYQWEGKPFASRCLAAVCRIWTRSRQAARMPPFEHPELLSECYRDTGPWKSHPTRMLGHKAVIQAARRCFGIYVMDEDEARNIGEVPASLPTATPYRLPTDPPVTTSDTVIDVAATPVESSLTDRFLVRIAAATDEGTLAGIDGDIHFQAELGKLSKPEVEALQAAIVTRFNALPEAS